MKSFPIPLKVGNSIKDLFLKPLNLSLKHKQDSFVLQLTATTMHDFGSSIVIVKFFRDGES
jgi:hypothetical protein